MKQGGTPRPKTSAPFNLLVTHPRKKQRMLLTKTRKTAMAHRVTMGAGTGSSGERCGKIAPASASP